MGEWVCTYVRVLAYLQLTVPLFCTQTLRDCLQRVTEQVGSGEGEGTDSSEGAEGRREANLAKIRAMLDTTMVCSVLILCLTSYRCALV